VSGPDKRQAYAYAHPLQRAEGDLSGYRRTRKHATGVLLTTILAVDR
jgi:hypothetical protein